LNKSFISWLVAMGICAIGFTFLFVGLIKPNQDYLYIGIAVCLVSIAPMVKSIQIALKEERMLNGL